MPDQVGSFDRYVFPVYAGVILFVFPVRKLKKCVPRVCGGDPKRIDDLDAKVECSPCMRG